MNSNNILKKINRLTSNSLLTELITPLKLVYLKPLNVLIDLNLDKKVLILGLEFSAAFDTIDYNIFAMTY